MSLIYLPKTVVLVGMMGAGKTSVGRLLASHWKVPFCDSDLEIETAANMSIKEIFLQYGEQALIDVEHRVVTRLLKDPPHVLSTGEGAFINPETRKIIQERSVSVWLKVSEETLIERVSRRTHRPQIQKGQEREQIEKLLEVREPIYSQAHITVNCGDKPTPETAKSLANIVENYLKI
jgi:shikimate kinase